MFANLLANEYCMIFDTNKLPLDFDKWIKLKIEDEDLVKTVNLHNCLLLNNYYSVVIDADVDFNVVIGGHIYKLKKGKKYFPFFPCYHYFYVQIDLYVNIFVEPNIYKKIKFDKTFTFSCYYLNELTELFNYCLNNLIDNAITPNNNTCIYTNVNILDDLKNQDLILKGGMMTSMILNYINIDIEKYYFILEKSNKEFLIPLLDKYIQYEYIKICKFK